MEGWTVQSGTDSFSLWECSPLRKESRVSSPHLCTGCGCRYADIDLHIQKVAPVSAAVGRGELPAERCGTMADDHKQRPETSPASLEGFLGWGVAGGNTGTPGLHHVTMSVWYLALIWHPSLYLSATLFILGSGCPAHLPSKSALRNRSVSSYIHLILFLGYFISLCILIDFFKLWNITWIHKSAFSICIQFKK